MWLFSGKASGFEFPHTKKCGYRTHCSTMSFSFLYPVHSKPLFWILAHDAELRWRWTVGADSHGKTRAIKCRKMWTWHCLKSCHQKSSACSDLTTECTANWQWPVPNSLSQKQFSNATLGITRLYNSVQAQPQTTRSLRCLYDLRYQRLEPYRVNFYKSFIDESFMLYM